MDIKSPNTKKGQGSINYVVVLILVLLIMAITFFFISNLNKNLVQSLESRNCDEAMRIYSLAPKVEGESKSEIGKIFAKGMIDMNKMSGKSNEIPCETKFIVIRDYDEKKINEQAGNALVSTWKTFGRGNYRLFSNTDGDNMNFCVIRYYLDFEDSAKNKEIPGLFYDMKNKEMKGYGENQLQYITNSVKPEPIDFTLNTKYDYAVVYVHSRDVRSIFSTLIGSGTGAGSGVITGVGILLIPGVGLLIPSTAIIGTTTVIGAIAGGSLGYDAKDLFAEEKGAVVLIPYTEEEINKLNCSFFPGKQDIKKSS